MAAEREEKELTTSAAVREGGCAGRYDARRGRGGGIVSTWEVEEVWRRCHGSGKRIRWWQPSGLGAGTVD